jgi:hypothetical protein
MTSEEEAVWWETHDTADYLGEFEIVEFRYEPEGPEGGKSINELKLLDRK